MTLDEDALAEAVAARERLEAAQDEAERARADYHRAIRRLHLAGTTLREIADALGLSHQRVHQIVGEDVTAKVLRDAPPAEAVLRLVKEER